MEESVIEQYVKKQDKFESDIGLFLPTKREDNTEIQKYLTMSRQELEKLTPTQCAEIAYLLSEYGFYLQRICNRCIMVVNTCESKIQDMISEPLKKTRGSFMTYSERYMDAIKNNHEIYKLYNQKQEAQSRIDRLSYLSGSIKHMCDILLNLQRAKTVENRG